MNTAYRLMRSAFVRLQAFQLAFDSMRRKLLEMSL